MLAAESMIDDEAVGVSPWRLAGLHMLFYLLCLGATLALRSPLWLLLVLLYSGLHRSALIGRAAYSSSLWKVLWICIVLSAVCCVSANALTLLLAHPEALHEVVWHTLSPMWLLVGIQQWQPEEWLDTILLPAIATLALGADVLYMKNQDRQGLLARRRGEGAESSQHNTREVRRPDVAAMCRFASSPLLAAVAWGVVWVSPPSCVGLWLEGATFVFISSALSARCQASAPPPSQPPSGSTSASPPMTHLINVSFAATAALLIVCVCATHNAAFTPVSASHSNWCTQMGLGYMAPDTGAGMLRAVQLAGMAVLVAAVAAVDAHATPPHSSAQSERRALLVAIEEDGGDGEAGRGSTAGAETPYRADDDHAVSRSGTARESRPYQRICSVTCSKHVSEVVAIACVMVLLLHAVYFPSLVSLALWLVHLCCCAGGLVSQPRRPPGALCAALTVCLAVLTCSILAQYVCVVLRVNPSTTAWAWQPALPYHVEKGGAVAVQVIGEHGAVLLLGLYLATREQSTVQVDGAGSVSDSDTPPSPQPSLARSASPQPVDEEEESTAVSGGDSPHRSWMVSQIRAAAGNQKELRKVFETAAGRSPRSAELDRLVTASLSPTAIRLSSSAHHLTVREVFDYVASGPLYTYAIIISLFVLGTSGASMDSLHAACLVLSLLFSIVGSNAVLYRRLRTLPPVWVAIVVGLQLGYRVFRVETDDPFSASDSTAFAVLPSSPPPAARGWWGSYISISAVEWKEVAPYLAGQLVLLWCYRYEPHLLGDCTQLWQCLIFRCRWTHLFRFVHLTGGFVVLLWIVLLLPRSVNVTVLVLLLFSAAILHHLRWQRLAYVWRRYLIVGYCGVVLLSMLFVEFGPMQPRLWRFLRAIGCPAGSEGLCARDVGLPSGTTAWLTPLALPWWFVIVLATAAGTPYALPVNVALPVASASSPSTALPVAEVLDGWRTWCLWWSAQLRATMLTVALLLSMTYAALHRPSLLTTAYLVGPVWGICLASTFAVAALHTALQCTYQFWFSPPFLDTYTLWGTPIATLIGLWKAAAVTPSLSAAAAAPGESTPSTLTVAAAPLLIGLLQALQQHQLPAAATATPAEDDLGGTPDILVYRSITSLPARQALRRLCASHLYVLLLLCLIHCTQKFVMGWGVALLLLVVWWAADLRECGVLLRPRWLYRLCGAATASLAVTAYVLHWTHERFPQWSVEHQWPWFVGSSKEVALSASCWTAAAACVALQWSSGGLSGDDCSAAEGVFSHPHCDNFITWMRQRMGRHRGMFGIRNANSIAEYPANQRDAFLADAAELLAGQESTADAEEGRDVDRQREEDPLRRSAVAGVALCNLHAWSVFVLKVSRQVPLVACGFVSIGATSLPSSLITIVLLIFGLLMALRHTRLQWSFWRWWRPLLVSCAALPLAALLFGVPPVRDAVLTLPPWIGLFVGLGNGASSSSSNNSSHVTGDGLRFTARHVGLFFALWVQGCLYNNPQWGVRLLRLQYAEKQLGETRHNALQQQLVARVTRATAQATRVDREIRAYLDDLRAGEDVADTGVTDKHKSCAGDGRGSQTARGSATDDNDGDGGGEHGVRDEAARRLSSFDAEMVPRPPLPPASPVNNQEGPEGEEEAPFPTSPLPTIAIPSSELRPAELAATASPLWANASGFSHSATWQQWRRRYDAVLRRTCNVLAAYTYHPVEYRVCNSATANTPPETRTGATPGTPTADFSLGQLVMHTLLTAVQVVLRHTPLALLACALVNALITGCLWELLGLCYVVQVALAYHPYAPRLVYHCFGLFVVAGVLLKQLVMLWVVLNTANPTPAYVAGTLLPLQKGSTYPWSSAAASRDSLHYRSLWMDILTLGVVVLHERVCVIHGVYVDESKTRRPVHGNDSVRAPPAMGAATAAVAVAGSDDGVGNRRSSHGEGEATAAAAASSARSCDGVAETTTSQVSTPGHGVRGALSSYYANVVSVAGVGEDWYVSYTTVDFLALLVLAVTYSHMTANEKQTLQDNVQNNQLPGPMALLLCMSVLQLVVDRMLYVQRCMRLKAAGNWAAALLYCVLYWWWRNTIAVSTHAAGNVYFSLKMVALVLSVTQVCRDFPVHRRRDAFTTHPGSLFRYSCFTVYRAIPFLWEARTLIDWTVQRTALTLQEYLTVEDVYVYMYHCRERCMGKRNEHAKVGDAVTRWTKWAFGVSRLALILLALLGPLLYYSTYNPSTMVNKVTQLNLELSFFGAHDFFSTTVLDNAVTPDGWWSWLARTRPTVALNGLVATDPTVQLMEFTSCSSRQWMASPQAMRQVLHGLRAAAAVAADGDGGRGDGKQETAAGYILQSMEMTRSASSTTSTKTVSVVNRWPIPKATAQAMVRILEHETGVNTTTAPSHRSCSGSGDDVTATAVLPFFYSPFLFNRASRLDGLPTDPTFPHRNRQHCTLELHHERDVALNTMVRYWCLSCAPLFPAGNVPMANTSSAAEWRCLTIGEGCEDFNYEDVNDTVSISQRTSEQRSPRAAQTQVPVYMVVLSDSVVVGISFLKGIGIVALYTTFVLALGRLLRSVLANKVSTLIFENIANPAVLENMVRCISVAREYGDLRLEHTIYLELIDLLRSPERLFGVTGSLRYLYVDAGKEDVFRLGQVRRRGGVRRDGAGNTVAAVAGGGGVERKEREAASSAVTDASP
jgi:hypothetical protein